MRAHLEKTVNKIKEKFYAPHGASKTKKLEHLKQRREAEKESRRLVYRTLDSYELHKSARPKPESDIVSCSL